MVANPTAVNGRCVAALRADYKIAKDLIRSIGGDELKFGLYRNMPVITTTRVAEWLADDELPLDTAKSYVHRTLAYDEVYKLCHHIVGDDEVLSAVFDVRFCTGKQGVILLTWQSVFLITLASRSKRGAMLRASLKVNLDDVPSTAGRIKSCLKLSGLTDRQRTVSSVAKQQANGSASNVVKLESRTVSATKEDLVSISEFCKKYNISSASIYVKYLPYFDFDFVMQGFRKCFKKEDENFLGWLIQNTRGSWNYRDLVDSYNSKNGTDYKLKADPSASPHWKNAKSKDQTVEEPVDHTKMTSQEETKKPSPYDSADIDAAIELFSDPSLMNAVKDRTLASIEAHNQEISQHQQEINRLNGEISKLQNVIARVEFLMELN